jgi:AraC-like DNA-binding protein
VRQQRLQRCADDLRNSALTIVNLTDIAHQWGFSDSAHFSRAFKGEFGQTPSHYRQQYS